MGYLGSWKIDDVLTFPAITHRFDTGALTDADAVPAYRIYEDETSTAILTGNMAKLDDANTTGFYSEAITLSAANGFEKGKCYTAYITAAVNSITGGQHHTFQIEAEVDANVVSDKASYTLANDAITAAVIATDAIDADAIADGAITSGVFASGAITAAAIATDAIGSDELAATAVTEIQTGLSTLDAAGIRTAVGLASANLDTQLSGIQSDTNDIQTRIPAALVSGRMSSDMIAISGSTAAADNLEAGAEGLVESTCAVGSTTTSVVTNLTEATDDHYNGRVITFITGALAGQSTSISDYVGSTKTMTVVALTEAPANTDGFVIS